VFVRAVGVASTAALRLIRTVDAAPTRADVMHSLRLHIAAISVNKELFCGAADGIQAPVWASGMPGVCETSNRTSGSISTREPMGRGSFLLRPQQEQNRPWVIPNYMAMGSRFLAITWRWPPLLAGVRCAVVPLAARAVPLRVNPGAAGAGGPRAPPASGAFLGAGAHPRRQMGSHGVGMGLAWG
jgi:hypothetical protein